MFPFQSGEELPFGISDDIVENTNTFTITCTSTPNQFLQPHRTDNTTSNLALKSPRNKRGRSKATNANKANNNHPNVDNNNEVSGNDVDKKRINHREVERQRRQEMSSLHSSLRSLLPVEYIRGKRSICDHVTEATRYITELEKSVKELGLKRDKLKDTLPSSEQQQPSINRDRDVGCSSSSSTTSTSEFKVSIHQFSRTLQIEIVAGSVVGDEEPYPLSKVLKVLADEGFDVVSCVSSEVNYRRIYVIYCEVDDVVCVDSSHLQEKLMSVVPSCGT